jgi:hypothetical protein
VGRFDKYICTTLEKRHVLPPPSPAERDRLAAMGRRLPMEHVHWIDSDVIPGAYYGETVWMWPPEYPHQVMWEPLAAEGYETPNMFPHSHAFPELLAWWAANPDDAGDLGPMAMQIDDEIIPLTSSWVAYIPGGLPHMPVFYSGTRSQIHTRPTFHWTSGPGGLYMMGDDGKEGHAGQAEKAGPEARVVDPATSKYGRYLVHGTDPAIVRPGYMRPLDPAYCRPMAYIDQTVIADAEFGCDTRWLLPGDTSRAGQLIMDEHTLPHGATVSCVALNYDDLTDLCAEVEFSIGGEKYVLDKGFWAYIPPEVSQGPLIVRDITKPVALVMTWPIGTGIEKYRGERVR